MGKRCQIEGCVFGASYGKSRSGKAEFCATHKPDNYVRCNYTQCRADDCPGRMAFGPRGGVAMYCSIHKLPDHINHYDHLTCQTEGCGKSKIHAYGAKFCAGHSSARDLLKVVPLSQPLKNVKGKKEFVEARELGRQKAVEKAREVTLDVTSQSIITVDETESSGSPEQIPRSPDLLSPEYNVDPDEELFKLIAARVAANAFFREKLRNLLN